ncbi:MULTISPECIES: ArdC family protein [Helicobacter]|uniref:ArdC family protein n=1 Tax=Helicobacter TaxID=209 RepID=UPI0023CF7132|nr:ArdC family protein [Helicobacter japonicus]MDE7235264.1 ArdC family protein [Helicobacter japonicus]
MSAAVYEELIEQIKTNAVVSIAASIKSQKAPFLRHQNASDMSRAYNAATGMPFNGINSLLLDIKKAEMGYTSNQWVSLTQANMLGAAPQEIEAAKTNWQKNAVSTHFIQKKEVKPIYSNEPLLDKEGNQVVKKNGEPAFKFATDEKGNVLYETKDIEPTLKRELLYNIENFPSIDRSRIKELNVQKEYKHIYKHSKEQQAGVKSVILEDIAEKLTPVTKEQIETYFKAQNYKQDYSVPKSLNQKQKEQVEQIATQIIKKQDEKATKVQKPTQEQEKAKTAKTEAPKTTKSKGRGR